jgi:hypothetical protein
MMDGILDRLIKLASLGASGVSIFAIFWIGWLLLRLPDTGSIERHTSLRMFMVTTVIIALISGATGLVNAMFNADEILKLRDDAHTSAAEYEKYKQQAAETIARYSAREAETRHAAESLAEVLRSKEAYNLQHPSKEIQTHIELLKAFLKRMGIRGTEGE